MNSPLKESIKELRKLVKNIKIDESLLEDIKFPIYANDLIEFKEKYGKQSKRD